MGSHTRDGLAGDGSPALRIDAEPFETLAASIADEQAGDPPRIARWIDCWANGD